MEWIKLKKSTRKRVNGNRALKILLLVIVAFSLTGCDPKEEVKNLVEQFTNKLFEKIEGNQQFKNKERYENENYNGHQKNTGEEKSHEL